MAEGDATTTTTTVPPSPSAPSTPAIDPAEYEELKRFRDEATQTFTRLQPFAEDLNWMSADEQNLEFIRQARKTYEDSRKAREPELDPATRRVLDEVKPLKEYVSKLEKREQDQVAREQAAFAQKTRSVRDRLVAEKPWLAENNDAGIYAIAAFGDRLGLTDLAEAAKAFDAAGQPKGVTPPRSLRGEASAAGVPGPSSLPPIKSAKDIRARLRSAFGNQGR
jgi:hypothetical protein